MAGENDDAGDDERGFFAEVPLDARATAKRLAKEAGPKHYHGHRERLRERFHETGADALADYELLELILFRTIPRADTKPVAKALLNRFKSLPEVFGAQEQLLTEVEGVGEAIGAGYQDHFRHFAPDAEGRYCRARGLVLMEEGA